MTPTLPKSPGALTGSRRACSCSHPDNRSMLLRLDGSALVLVLVLPLLLLLVLPLLLVVLLLPLLLLVVLLPGHGYLCRRIKVPYHIIGPAQAGILRRVPDDSAAGRPHPDQRLLGPVERR